MDPTAIGEASMYISKRYLLAAALVGAIVVGFFSHLITDQIGAARPGARDASTPGAVVGRPAVATPTVAVPSAPAGAPVAPIVSQPGGGGSTTNIYLTIVNTPAGTTAVPPAVNVVPGP